LPHTTDWTQVCLIIIAGIIGACQIGKLAIAVPMLQVDLGLSLVTISWVAGAYALLGVIGGFATGYLVSFFRTRAVVITGLLAIALGSFIGAAATGAPVLIASRVLEGAGFLAMVVACPPLLRSAVTPGHQQVVFAFWSAYIPIGALAMMVAGPFIMQGDWRVLWIFNGSLATLHALVLLGVGGRSSQAIARPARLSPRAAWDALRAPIPLLLALCFALYTIQYFALATFLPTFLIERLDLSLATAGAFSAAILTANAVGNIGAGLVLRAGVSLTVILAGVFGVVGVTGFAIFSPAMPAALLAVAAIACMGFAALLPASVIASMPRFAPGATQLMLALGLVQQASSIGQLAGPALFAVWVERFGWAHIYPLFALIGLTGLVLVATLRRATAKEALTGATRA